MSNNQDYYLNDETRSSLKKFQVSQNIFSKGKLSLVIQFTRMVKEKAFPLRVEDFQTDSRGQVSGISGSNLKRILRGHGITRQLTVEGGRTSRGSMGLMIAYVDFLNCWAGKQKIDWLEVENFWADEILNFFNHQPLSLTADKSKTIRANLDDLFEQAKMREEQNEGTRYLGVILQHLVAAKLRIMLGRDAIEIYGASVADSSTNRSGDFTIHNTVIHCTTKPGDPLMEKCRQNLLDGKRPIIITIYDRLHTAITMLEDAALVKQVEVWDIQQFLATNIMEHSLFKDTGRNAALAHIIQQYNVIVEDVERDPSLRIDFDGN